MYTNMIPIQWEFYNHKQDYSLYLLCQHNKYKSVICCVCIFSEINEIIE